MWLELYEDYDMSVLYHPNKSSVVVDPLFRMTIGSVSHVEEGKKYRMKDIHRLVSFGVRLEDSTNNGFMTHNNSK